VNNKALLPQRDTKSTMIASAFITPQLYVSGAWKWLPQVSKPRSSRHSVVRYVLGRCTNIERGIARAAGAGPRLAARCYVTLASP